MTLKGVWIDESDKTQCGALYSQCVTRVMTTGGFVIQTFTPENGVDDVVRKFIDAEQDPNNHTLKLHMASMYDAHVEKGGHITDKMIQTIKDGCPEYEWECRINGIPSAGSGAVFPLKDSEIICDDFHDNQLPSNWDIVCAFDIGKVVDPSVVSFVAKDPTTKISYLVEQIYLQGSIYDKDAKAIANVIKNSRWPNVLTISPHDGGLNSQSPESVAKKMIEYGVNVSSQPFRNPSDTQLQHTPLTQSGGLSVRSIETGLQEMRTMFREGTLKICRGNTHWFKENRTYFYEDKGKPVDRDNHCIDSSRYGILSMVGGKCTTVSEAITGDDNGWKNIQPLLNL